MKGIVRFVLASAIAVQLPFAIAKASIAQDQPSGFECRTDDGIHYTIALRSDGEVSDPAIVWTSVAFSDSGFPPARRCADVTDRLNALLADNDYSLDGLYLTQGRVNRQSVICAVESTRLGCNNDNLLFTLSGDNARNPNNVLENLSGRVSGVEIQESGGKLYVDLDELVQGLF